VPAVVSVVLLLHATSLGGCVSYRPKAIEDVRFLERARTKTEDGVRVTAAALGRSEARDLFGVPISKNGIQPLYLKIENESARPYIFFQQSVDSDYYSPREAAFKSHYSGTKRFLGWGLAGIFVWPLLLVAPVQYASARVANRRMNKLFVEYGIGNQMIFPRESFEGFIFTQLDEGTKHVKVGLLNPDEPIAFDMTLPVPGVKADHERLDVENVWPDREIPDFGSEELRGALEDLPCCAENEKGETGGDPLNLVVIGTLEELVADFARAGWDETEIIDLATSLRTAGSFLFGSQYRYSHVSNLYLYGRPQDVAFQKARETIHERNHLRLWVAPFTFRGKPVWVGQVSRDIGVKFTTRAWNLTTHVIDPDVDDSRENVMGDLLRTGRVATLGWVPGVPPTLQESPAENFMGDPYWTDGYRAVVLLAGEPVVAEFFQWLDLAGEIARRAAAEDVEE
jgi:hypothetical protein